MKFSIPPIGLLATSFLCTHVVEGTVTVYTDKAEFLSALGGITPVLEDFESFDNSALEPPTNDPWYTALWPAGQNPMTVQVNNIKVKTTSQYAYARTVSSSYGGTDHRTNPARVDGSTYLWTTAWRPWSGGGIRLEFPAQVNAIGFDYNLRENSGEFSVYCTMGNNINSGSVTVTDEAQFFGMIGDDGEETNEIQMGFTDGKEIMIDNLLYEHTITPIIPQDPAPLEQKWNISEDASFEYSSLSFKLGYTVSDFISNADVRRKLDDTTYYPSSGMARFSVYDEGCKEDGVQILANGTSGIESIVEDDAEIGDAAGLGYSMNREVFVNITLDAEKISQNELLYSEDTSGFQVTAEIRFCVRFGLHTTSATSVEVNFLETLVTLNVDLTDGFEIGSIAVEPRDRLVRTANQVYLVVGYRCDAAGLQLSTTAAITQGTVVKVCVKPDAEAEADGIHMRSIDDFSWSRVSPNVVNQPAIIGPNRIAANQLTTLDCDSGYEMCSFETILFAAFYTTPGAVLGSGVASMQFGSTDNTPNTRRLRGDTEQGRDLQEDDAAAAAEFELDFDVAQATAEGTSGAASYGAMASMVFGMIAVALM